MFIAKKQEMVPGHKLMPCMHPDTRFRNGSRAATKWHETTPNMSFEPEEEDLACSLLKTKNWFQGTNSCLVSTPILVFAMGHVRQRNGAKPPQTRVLDLKKWIGHVCCEKTRNGSGAQTHALYPPRYAFSQWVSAATKWRETTLNMRFGPKEVDWACSL